MEMIPVKAFDNYFSANIILTRLQQAGVYCYLKDEYTVTIDPFLSNAIGGIKLAVDKEDLEKATALLKQFEEEYLQTVECPKCKGNKIMHIKKPGAKNMLTALLSWLVAGYAIAPEEIYQCQDCGYETASLPENKAAYN